MRHTIYFGLVCALFGLGPRSLKAGGGPAGSPPAVTRQQARLETFLRRYIGPRDSDDNRDTRYQSVFVGLTGHGSREAIVYLMGNQAGAEAVSVSAISEAEWGWGSVVAQPQR